MNKKINKLLQELEPEIDKKCLEIKTRQKERKQNIFFTILMLIFLLIPSILFILNISLIYFIMIVLLILIVRLFIKLPNILKEDWKGVQYE